MRRAATVGVLSAIVLLMVGLANITGQSAVELVMITYGGQSQEPHKFYLAEPFEKSHPGVKVILVADEGGEYIARVQASLAAGRPSPVDLAPNDEPPHLQLIAMGLVERINAALVPNLKDVYESYVAKTQGYGVPATYSLIGIAYNSQKVTKVPKSWKDLWDPAYKGKVGLVSPTSNLGLGFLVAAAKAYGGNEGNLEPVWEALKQLQPFIIAPNPTGLAAAFERGEVVIGPLWNDRAGILASKGLPIKFVKPEDGAMAVLSMLSIIKGSRHAQLAHELLNQVLSVEYQTKAAAKPYYFGPTNSKVRVPSDVAALMPTTVAEVRKLQTVNWSLVVPKRAGLLDRWNREFSR